MASGRSQRSKRTKRRGRGQPLNPLSEYMTRSDVKKKWHHNKNNLPDGVKTYMQYAKYLLEH